LFSAFKFVAHFRIILKIRVDLEDTNLLTLCLSVNNVFEGFIISRSNQ